MAKVSGPMMWAQRYTMPVTEAAPTIGVTVAQWSRIIERIEKNPEPKGHAASAAFTSFGVAGSGILGAIALPTSGATVPGCIYFVLLFVSAACVAFGLALLSIDRRASATAIDVRKFVTQDMRDIAAIYTREAADQPS